MELQVGVKVLLENKEHKFSLLENLAREVQEEIGLILKEPPTLIAAQDILKSDKHVVRLTYRGTIEGTPVLSSEHSEYAWRTVSELREMENLDKYVKELLDSTLRILD